MEDDYPVHLDSYTWTTPPIRQAPLTTLVAPPQLPYCQKWVSSIKGLYNQFLLELRHTPSYWTQGTRAAQTPIGSHCH